MQLVVRLQKIHMWAPFYTWICFVEFEHEQEAVRQRQTYLIQKDVRRMTNSKASGPDGNPMQW